MNDGPKIECISCGALVLPSTARRTGGLCMPCKNGTRQTMETERRWRQECEGRFRADPLSILWTSLVKRVYASPDGFTTLSQAEQRYFSVVCLDGEVHNGGFQQFFYNSSGAHYEVARQGLGAMGLAEAVRLLLEAKLILFGDAEVPAISEVRRNLLQQSEKTCDSQRLETIDSEWSHLSRAVLDQCCSFAATHGLVGRAQPV